jgi:hypothetical protein
MRERKWGRPLFRGGAANADSWQALRAFAADAPDVGRSRRKVRTNIRSRADSACPSEMGLPHFPLAHPETTSFSASLYYWTIGLVCKSSDGNV